MTASNTLRSLMAVSTLAGLISCSPGKEIREGLAETNETLAEAVLQIVEQLDDAVDTMNVQSENWRSTVTAISTNWDTRVETALRDQIPIIIGKAVSGLGAEFRCDVDFVTRRTRDALLRLRTQLLNIIRAMAQLRPLSLPAPTPAICHAVPSTVVLASVPNAIPALEWYGYDFWETTQSTVRSHMKAFVETVAGQRRDVSTHLSFPHAYLTSLNLGANGARLDGGATRISLEWNGDPISTVPISTPSTPVCQSQSVSFSQPAFDHVPLLVSGNSDFQGDGPSVHFSLALGSSPDRIYADVFMSASATKKTATVWGHTFTVQDKTRAELSKRHELSYRPPTGWKIDRIASATTSAHHYVDSDTTPDVYRPGGAVERLTYVGDTVGADVEQDNGTRVTISLGTISIELAEVANCTSAHTVRTFLDQLTRRPRWDAQMIGNLVGGMRSRTSRP